MSNALTERIAQEHAAAEESLPGGVVTRPRRRHAIAALVANGLPTVRDENWRYANLRPLERARFTPASQQPNLRPAALRPALGGYLRYVYLDGAFVSELSASGAPPPGVAVHALRDAPAGVSRLERPEGTEPRSDAFALLNEAFAMDGANIVLTRAAGEPADAPVCIEVIFIALAKAEDGASYPRLEVQAGPGTRLRLIERHLSAESAASPASLVVGAVEMRIARDAAVDHYRIQQLGARAAWLDSLYATVDRSASYRLHAFALGAQSARSTLCIRLQGEGAELAQHAVAAGERQQVLDSYTVVEHAAAHTRTEQSFRGIAGGRSRVAFNGKVIVRPGAHGADSSQSLRGLLAGSEAEIDVRPQLEIYTDEVRCSHGATAGKLDENMLFYLLSRGLEPATARRLLKWAFLEDVVSKVAVPELRRQIEESLADRMEHADVLKESL